MLPLKWVFTYKFDSEGYLVKHKARICVRGDLQAISQQELYAATGAMKTFRILMALVAAFDLECWQMDAIAAFTNAEIDHTVYVACAEGFEETGMVLLLQRALYGLRKSPKLWFEEMSATLQKQGCYPCSDEPFLFVHEKQLIYIFVYVDDFLLIAPKEYKEHLEAIKQKLQETYEFRDLGEVEHFLSVRVVRDRKVKKLSLL